MKDNKINSQRTALLPCSAAVCSCWWLEIPSASQAFHWRKLFWQLRTLYLQNPQKNVRILEKQLSLVGVCNAFTLNKSVMRFSHDTNTVMSLAAVELELTTSWLQEASAMFAWGVGRIIFDELGGEGCSKCTEGAGKRRDRESGALPWWWDSQSKSACWKGWSYMTGLCFFLCVCEKNSAPQHKQSCKIKRLSSNV